LGLMRLIDRVTDRFAVIALLLWAWNSRLGPSSDPQFEFCALSRWFSVART